MINIRKMIPKISQLQIKVDLMKGDFNFGLVFVVGKRNNNFNTGGSHAF